MGLCLLLAGNGLLINAQESRQLMADSTTISQQPFPRFRIALSGGITLKLIQETDGKMFDFENIPDPPKAIITPVINLDAGYYVKPHSSIGLKYLRLMDTYDKQGFRDAKTVNFIGPLFYQNLKLRGNKSRLAFGGSIGYYGYQRKITSPNYNRSAKLGNIGGLLEIAYDIRIAKHIYLGINTGIIGAELPESKLIQDNENPNTRKGAVNRKVDFFISGGIRFVR